MYAYKHLHKIGIGLVRWKLRLTTCAAFILCLIAVIQLFTVYGTYNYTHIPYNSLYEEIYKEVNPKLIKDPAKPECKYDYVLQTTKHIFGWQVPKKYDDFSAAELVNGSFSPTDCNPLISVAILVTYRNRQSQLDIFLPFMHNFLRKQNIHYKIYLIEQQDEKPWNKGLLYNIGAKQAIADKFPCLILHDVDLLPLDESNLYACFNQPRHLSASIDKFRYVLIYETLVGGVLAVRSDQYIKINGFSNRFEHWGGEDDDLAKRINNNGLSILRFPQAMSRYTMITHKPETRNRERLRIIEENKHTFKADGFNSVHYLAVQVKEHRLFTLVGVKL